MSYAEKHEVVIQTATGGGATGYTPVVTGRIAAIIFTRPTGDPLASTADLTITTEDTAQTLWNESNVTASKTVRPVAAAQLTSGADSSLTEAALYAVNERVKVSVAQGGNTKNGTFTVIVE